MSDTQLADMAKQLAAEYHQLKELGLQLDLTRGKPCTEQVALSDAMDGILAGDFFDAA